MKIYEPKEVNTSQSGIPKFHPINQNRTLYDKEFRKFSLEQSHRKNQHRNKTKTRIKRINEVGRNEDRDELPLLYPDANCTRFHTGFRHGYYCLPELDYTDYFMNNKIRHCFKEGTFSIQKNGTECRCKSKWYGQYCSMHNVAYFSEYPKSEYAYMVSHQTRRVINAITFQQEFALLEARIHELNNVVDLFIIVESNYTFGSHPRRRLLEQKMKTGYLAEFQHKIMYMKHGLFIKKAYHNIHLMEASVKNTIADGLKLIKNLRMTDILVLNDADEIPKRESIIFLKYHYGYPQPVGFHFIPNTYGFYWTSSSESAHKYGACSMSMLFHLFYWEPYRLSYAGEQTGANRNVLDHFKYKHNGAVRPWSFGTQDLFQASGWHCSWCLKPGDIKKKLEGSHWSFHSQWKAFPGLISEPRIKYNVAKGIWIDGKTYLISVNNTNNLWYAPAYLRNNTDMYRHLLIKPEYS